MKSLLRIPLVTLLALFILGCPKKAKDDAEVGDTATQETPAPGPTKSVRYHWSGGLSLFEYYSLTIEQTEAGGKAHFAVKTFKGEEQTVSEPLAKEDYAEFEQLLTAAHVESIKQQPRGMRIMDIGTTKLTVLEGGATKAEIFEDGETTAGEEWAPLRAWLDLRVRGYLEAAAKPPVK